MLTGFLGTPSAPGSGHGLTAADINISSGLYGIQLLLDKQDGRSSASPIKPRAFINVLFFDEQFKSYDYRVSMAGSANAVKDHYSDLQNIAAEKNGYVYIYCSNESPVDVFFDNLQVVHTRGQILEEAHYYPYGMKIANISSRAAGALQNRYLYQGDFSEFDAETGYNEFYLRHYDPQIGRWTTADPYNQFASPYVGMGNNPVLNIDATGACVWCESLENALTLTEVVVIMPRPSAVLSTRILGGLKAVGGLLEAGVGIAAGLATSWTGVGAVGGALVAAHGGDVAASGFSQLVTGRPSKSFTEQGISRGLQTVGMSAQQADQWAGNADAGISIVGSGYSGGTIVRGAPAVGRSASAVGGAAKTGTTVFKTFTKSNFRHNLGQLTGNIPANSQAHHVFPQKFQSIFSSKGINIHDPKFGAWWNTSDHLKNASGYNAAWESFLKTNPSQSQIMNYGRQLMGQYGIPVGF